MTERPERIVARPNPEYRRQVEARREFLVPIYMQSSKDVPFELSMAALQGTYDALIASGQQRDIENFGTMQSTVDYGSTQWYIDQTYKTQSQTIDFGYGKALDAPTLLGLFYEEPWQQIPHWELIVVNNDLVQKSSEGNTHFLMGLTNPDFPASVISIRRFMEERYDGYRSRMVRRLARHEVGHMFGLVQNERGVTGSHCNEVCTMRAVGNPEQFIHQMQQEDQYRIKFCAPCLSDLEKSKTRYKYL